MQNLPNGYEAWSNENLVKLVRQLWVHLQMVEQDNAALRDDVQMMLNLQRREWLRNGTK